MRILNAKQIRKNALSCVGVTTIAMALTLSGCGTKESAEVAPVSPATNQAAPATTQVSPQTVPASAGTSGVGISPSNTISQKEQAEMAAEKAK